MSLNWPYRLDACMQTIMIPTHCPANIQYLLLLLIILNAVKEYMLSICVGSSLKVRSGMKLKQFLSSIKMITIIEQFKRLRYTQKRKWGSTERSFGMKWSYQRYLWVLSINISLNVSILLYFNPFIHISFDR